MQDKYGALIKWIGQLMPLRISASPVGLSVHAANVCFLSRLSFPKINVASLIRTTVAKIIKTPFTPTMCIHNYKARVANQQRLCLRLAAAKCQQRPDISDILQRFQHGDEM